MTSGGLVAGGSYALHGHSVIGQVRQHALEKEANDAEAERKRAAKAIKKQTQVDLVRKKPEAEWTEADYIVMFCFYKWLQL